MGPAIVWAVTWLALAGLVIWRGERLVRAWLEACTTVRPQDEVALQERRLAVEIAQGTLEATIAFKNAELAKVAAEARAATELGGELKEDRLKAERAIIQAHVEAEKELAIEVVRGQHEARHGDSDILDQYERYLRMTRERGISAGNVEDLEDFIEIMDRLN